jgi:serine/threonine protein kinase
MNLSHPCDPIANAPRRIHIEKCRFNYENKSYRIVINKLEIHNNLKICFADLYLNEQFNKKIVIKAYGSTNSKHLNQDLYNVLVDEIKNHSEIEAKVGYSNYFSHMLFHFWTKHHIGIIFDDFGTTLDKINITNYSLKYKIQMVSQLISQVNFLQENNIYHGDLKPSNICMGPDGNIVLIDFGIGYLEEYHSNKMLNIKYNTTITSGSSEYSKIYFEYCAGNEFPKELFDKSQHFAVGGLIFGILTNKPTSYFSKCLEILISLKNPNEKLEKLNLPNRFKYFNKQFSNAICEFISKELDTVPELIQFKPILLNMFEYDYTKRQSLNLIASQFEKINT